MSAILETVRTARTRFADTRSNRINPQMVETCHPDHMQRYEFAEPRVLGKRVLDIGCGFGYGSNELAATASRVVAIDVYDVAIDFARRTYRRDNLEYRCGDFLEVDLEPGSFDVIVSFEVIEHVRDQAAFAARCAELLAPDGVAILSTPNRLVMSPHGGVCDPTHIREFSPAEFRELLVEGGFAEIDQYGQHASAEFWARADVRYKLGNADKLHLRRLLPPGFKSFLIRAVTRGTRSEAVGDAPIMQITEQVDGAFTQLAVAQPR
jgi:ubiquinone biosynthesis O-methyltransferase